MTKTQIYIKTIIYTNLYCLYNLGLALNLGSLNLKEQKWTNHLQKICTKVCRKVIFEEKKYLSIHLAQNLYCALGNSISFCFLDSFWGR